MYVGYNHVITNLLRYEMELYNLNSSRYSARQTKWQNKQHRLRWRHRRLTKKVTKYTNTVLQNSDWLKHTLTVIKILSTSTLTMQQTTTMTHTSKISFLITRVWFTAGCNFFSRTHVFRYRSTENANEKTYKNDNKETPKHSSVAYLEYSPGEMQPRCYLNRHTRHSLQTRSSQWSCCTGSFPRSLWSGTPWVWGSIRERSEDTWRWGQIFLGTGHLYFQCSCRKV